ncbi:MAG: FMN-binding protein [Gemmatimonadota bacterium]|nr:MAG: FMN-binding protein [Gemmatimonadota bacterium]
MSIEARAPWAGILLAISTSANPLQAQATLTQQEALAAAFPRASEIERRTAFLSEADQVAARDLAGPGVEVSQSVVTYYVGKTDSELLGYAYFDSHRVRTLPEVLMVVVSPADEIVGIEVLRFSEPPEYRPPGGWLERFAGHRLAKELSLKGSIDAITGATLTSSAVTDAVRRVLAIHSIIERSHEGVQ